MRRDGERREADDAHVLGRREEWEVESPITFQYRVRESADVFGWTAARSSSDLTLALTLALTLLS